MNCMFIGHLTPITERESRKRPQSARPLPTRPSALSNLASSLPTLPIQPYAQSHPLGVHLSSSKPSTRTRLSPFPAFQGWPHQRLTSEDLLPAADLQEVAPELQEQRQVLPEVGNGRETSLHDPVVAGQGVLQAGPLLLPLLRPLQGQRGAELQAGKGGALARTIRLRGQS